MLSWAAKSSLWSQMQSPAAATSQSPPVYSLLRQTRCGKVLHDPARVRPLTSSRSIERPLCYLWSTFTPLPSDSVNISHPLGRKGWLCLVYISRNRGDASSLLSCRSGLIEHACHDHLRVRGLGCRRLAGAGRGICSAGSRFGTDRGVCAGLLCVGSTAPCRMRPLLPCAVSSMAACRGTLHAMRQAWLRGRETQSTSACMADGQTRPAVAQLVWVLERKVPTCTSLRQTAGGT